MREVYAAKSRGCDHAVLVGQGEPMLWPFVFLWVEECAKAGITTSIITNGALPIKLYEDVREAGLDHLHISMHGLASINDIAERPTAASRQKELREWLKKEEWPWRMNMTIQKLNVHELAETALACIDHGCKHIIPLGFLPHYDWQDPVKLREVAVHPEIIGKEIERLYDQVVSKSDALFTIRYHPMCHLRQDLRKYVVNARHVLYDPWEWEYGYLGLDDHSYYAASVSIGESVAIQGAPCSACSLRDACGGWNRVYAAGYDGAKLCAIPGERVAIGDLHNQNPANVQKGYYR